ncbi:hypothetical protein [Sphingomonas sp. OTU376]|uniref:hypothetical protein n=1 Tax=Sphingomonas sp. OTU376 TaxID=3043863 RepID=UPI00313E15FA
MVDTSATFTAVDLLRLPVPSVIEELSYEQILAGWLVDFEGLFGPEDPEVFDALVESDPAMRVLQVAAYREFLMRGRVNDAAKAVMPATQSAQISIILPR